MKVLQHHHSRLRKSNAGGTYEHTPDHSVNPPTVYSSCYSPLRMIRDVKAERESRHTFTCTERPIYGSSRVGMDVTKVVYTTETAPLLEGEAVRLLGNKQYEISNHLGNVLVVVSDIKIIVQDEGTITGYQAQIISATDYSPFGVVLEGRSWSVGSVYRYGFQAQEQDAELWEGAVNYKYRVEDPRLGRFFSVDPLNFSFPWNSNYAFCENQMIQFVELEGLEKDCPDPKDWGGGDKPRRLNFPKLRLFTAKVVLDETVPKSKIVRAKRWNSQLRISIKDAGNLIFKFETEAIPDRLQATGPSRGSVDSGFIATNPDGAEDDPGSTYESRGSGSALVTVYPNPDADLMSFWRRNFTVEGMRSDETVYRLEITDTRFQRKLIHKVLFLGFIPVYRK